MRLAALDTGTPFGERRPGPAASLAWRVATFRWKPNLKRRIRRLARRFAGPFDVRIPVGEARELAFRAYPAENYCDRILVGRGRLPERAEHEALIPYLRPGMTFVDIGANVGTYSAFVGVHVPDARIVAFEPHPRTAAKLRFNLASNGVRAEVVEAAIGPEAGRMQLWSDGGGNIGQTSLLPEATSNAKLSIEVAIVPLLGRLQESDIHHIDLLKIDVEGFEDRALSPFLASSPRAMRPRAILLEEEHHDLWEDALLDRLAGLGYRETFRTAQNALYVRDA